jgi:hypothetical protein
MFQVMALCLRGFRWAEEKPSSQSADLTGAFCAWFIEASESIVATTLHNETDLM